MSGRGENLKLETKNPPAFLSTRNAAFKTQKQPTIPSSSYTLVGLSKFFPIQGSPADENHKSINSLYYIVSESNAP
jgi:hypothetical protein